MRATPPGADGDLGRSGLPLGLRRAGMGRRWVARFIDVALLVVFLMAVIVVAVFGDTYATVAGSVFLLVASTYEIVMVTLTGATLGKRWLHIQVVRLETGRPPNLGFSALRFLLVLVLGASFFGLPLILSPSWDRSGREQGWHDKAAGTVVVRSDG